MVECAPGRPRVAVQNIKEANRKELSKVTAELDPELRKQCIQYGEAITQDIADEIEAKTAFHFCEPNSFLKVIAPSFGGSIDAGIQCATEYLRWYDELDDKKTCPGCLQVFLRPNPIRNQLMQHVHERQPLHHFAALWQELMAAAL